MKRRPLVAVTALALTSSIASTLFLATAGSCQYPPRQNGGDARAYYDKAMQAFQNKDYSTTIRMCNMAMSNGTHSKDLVHLMALSYKWRWAIRKSNCRFPSGDQHR